MEEHIMMPESMEEVAQQATTTVSGFKESIKNGWDFVISKIRDYKGNILEVGVYLAIGFAVGYLLKKYLKYILLLVLFIVTLVILEQFDLVHTSVNIAKLQELFNMQPTIGFDSHSYLEWIKTNFVVVLAASVGFLIGLKVG